MIPLAHQKVIRDRMALADPRPQNPNLDGCCVEEISVNEASTVILTYEYLGTMPNATLACYGLRSATSNLLGAVCFNRGGGPRALDVLGPEYRFPIVVLARGCCVHWAPRNAASFLIRHACRLASKAYGWVAFIAYADPEAGELGTV